MVKFVNQWRFCRQLWIPIFVVKCAWGNLFTTCQYKHFRFIFRPIHNFYLLSTWSFLNRFQSILFLWVTQIRLGATPTSSLETIPSISCLFSSPPTPTPHPPLLLLDTSQVWYFLAFAAVLKQTKLNCHLCSVLDFTFITLRIPSRLFLKFLFVELTFKIFSRHGILAKF